MDYILYLALGEHLTIEQSLDRIPEVLDIAGVEAEDLISVGSTAIEAPIRARLFSLWVGRLIKGD